MQCPPEGIASARDLGLVFPRPLLRILGVQALAPSCRARDEANNACNPNKVDFQVFSPGAKATNRTRSAVLSWPLSVAVVVMGFFLHGGKLREME